MSICAYCGHPTRDDGLCAFHGADFGVLEPDDWAAGNRIMCDFIHRGIVLERPRHPACDSIDSALDRFDVEEPVLV